ncbi:MAG TPA: pyridoxal-phosphate dependent enzyme [Acidimicrobiales bacterium]
MPVFRNAPIAAEPTAPGSPTSGAPAPGPAPGEVLAFHRGLPGYAPTPVVELPRDLAEEVGAGRVLVKAEVERLGLPSFKVLGASWAAHRLLAARPEGSPAVARLVAATDGNHGRAVAHMAALWGLQATILVPAGTAAARIDAIADEGADVVVVDGTYDDAVARSAELADDVTLVVSDTSWPGYEDVPRWVIEGYTTIFAELADQLDARPDVAFVPLGVGALGAAAVAGLPGTALVGVEPDTADCVRAAVAAGEVVEVPGPHRSIMAGLNCGFASPVALPAIAAGFHAFVTVDDDRARDAVRRLAAAGLEVGETGAAALAGLLEAPELVPEGATVLLLATEGVTDPVNYEAIVGRPPS